MHCNRHYFIAALLALPVVSLLWSSPTHAQFADPARNAKLEAAFPEVDRLVREFLEREHVPGAAWGIVVDGKVAHIGTAGFRDLAKQQPVEGGTVFRIASMTKSFTAMAILQLRDAGQLLLDDPAEKYVPELRKIHYPSADSPRLTLRHLLTHSGGFPEDNPWGDQQLARSEEEFTAMLREGIPFSNPPGIAYEYSNYGFAILGRVVTRVSGMPYTQYVEQKILRPLHMDSTTLEPAAVPAGRLAHGYRWEDGQWKEEPQLANGAFGSMGGMLTSIDDLTKYVGVFLAAWPPRDAPETAPLKRSSLREMQQAWRPNTTTVTRDANGNTLLNVASYGYGLRIAQTCNFRHVVAHTGGLPGFGSQMRWLPEYGVGLIGFGSRTYTPWGKVFDSAFETLRQTGALQPRQVLPAQAFIAAQQSVTRLVVEGWNEAMADDLAAMNLFLDSDRPHRRAALEAVHNEVGGSFRVRTGSTRLENTLRGVWLLDCERGTLQASITLAPTEPAKVQFLEVKRVPPEGEAAPKTCQ
jgi:CubicO group peptidase (beta-lactamase class C family)